MNQDHSEGASAVLKEGASTTDAAAYGRMEPTLKAKWVAALRSGEYPQGNLQLRTNDGRFCCLGVLCDIVDPARWAYLDYGYGNDKRYFFGDEWAYLPEDVIARTAIPDYAWKRVSNDMNDRGTPFPEIADWIDANL